MKQLNNLLSVFSAKPLMLLFFFTLLPAFANAQCPDNNHPHMIDLGLPSGTKWACCNVGAQKPEDYGGYYAWGETEEKDVYNWDTYLYGFYDIKNPEDYSNLVDIGNDIASTQYDVAYVTFGSSWMMPNKTQMKELVESCMTEWTTENGVNGRKFIGPNGSSIFFPASGFKYFVHQDPNGGYYQTSSRYDYDPYGPSGAYMMYFNSERVSWGWRDRNDGQSVRPVVASSSTPSGIAIDETNFPDENFRNWVLAQEYGQDGVLMGEEIATVRCIDISYNGITNLKGIDFFTALTELDCNWNQLTSLDVSKNTALKSLFCYYNQLTSLDVSKNTALTELDCNFNKLTSLNVSNNTALTYLSCDGNQLTSIDVSKNMALTMLDCTNNQLSSLELSKNTALTWLECDVNWLTSLDVSNNTALTMLACSWNKLTSLDVSKNTELTELECGGNQLTFLDVSKNTALTEFWCGDNQLTFLDVSHNTELTQLGAGAIK